MLKDTTFPLYMAISSPPQCSGIHSEYPAFGWLQATSSHISALERSRVLWRLPTQVPELSLLVCSAENPCIFFYCICPNLKIAAVLLWNRAALSFIPTSTVWVVLPGLCENHSSQVNGQGPLPLPFSLRCYCLFSKQLCFSGVTPLCLSNRPAFYIIKAEDFISITG